MTSELQMGQKNYLIKARMLRTLNTLEKGPGFSNRRTLDRVFQISVTGQQRRYRQPICNSSQNDIKINADSLSMVTIRGGDASKG